MRTLRSGDTGAEVAYLQQCLTDLGYSLGMVDSKFGPKTEGAVEQYQMAHNLVPDGIVGGNTWSSIHTSERTPPASMLGSGKQHLKSMVDWAGDVDTPNTKAVLSAISYLGCKEIPTGSNTGSEIASLVGGYNAYWSIDNRKCYPWCAMAVSTWIGQSLGLGNSSYDIKWSLHPFGSFLGGVAQIENWGKEQESWYRAGHETPEIKCGSIFTMGRGGSDSDPSSSIRAGHTGLVVAVHDNGTVTTIEGNTSNRVKSLTRDISTLRGFVSWWDVL